MWVSFPGWQCSMHTAIRHYWEKCGPHNSTGRGRLGNLHVNSPGPCSINLLADFKQCPFTIINCNYEYNREFYESL